MLAGSTLGSGPGEAQRGKGIPGNTAGTPTSLGVVAQGTLRGAVTSHPICLSQPHPWDGDTGLTASPMGR